MVIFNYSHITVADEDIINNGPQAEEPKKAAPKKKEVKEDKEKAEEPKED